MASIGVCKLRNFHLLKIIKWTVPVRLVSFTRLRLNFASIKCRKLSFNHKTLRYSEPLCSPRNLSNSSHSAGRATEDLFGDDQNNQSRLTEEAEVGQDIKRLSATVTPEFEKEILEGKSALKLKQVLYEILRLETRVFPFPLPSELTVEQWRTLLTFEDRTARFYYLDSLVWGSRTLEELREMDDRNCNPLIDQVTEELLKQAFGDDENSLESRRRVSMCLMHHEMQRQNGERMPVNILMKDLKAIAEIDHYNGYLRYLNYMHTRELSNLSDYATKRCRQARSEPAKRKREEDIANEKHIYYGLGQNCIILRTNNKTIDEYCNWQAAREFYDWGQPLVIDFSFLDQYRNLETSSKSLVNNEIPCAYNNNRSADYPFQLHFTGVNEGLKSKLKKTVPTLECCVNVTDQNPMDMFDPDRLVYLSPDSRNDLLDVSPGDIYVIGGIVDRHDRQPLTLSRAKRYKIRHARFPMKRIIGLKADLNVDTCVAILCDMKATQDWFYSLRWVPARYLGHRTKGTKAPNLEHQLAYRAHKALSPTSSDEVNKIRNKTLCPRKYREMYERIMKSKSREEMDQILQELVI